VIEVITPTLLLDESTHCDFGIGIVGTMRGAS
jgi:hypothetical protein